MRLQLLYALDGRLELCRKLGHEKATMARQVPERQVQQYTREQMEQLAKNPDNIVMMEQERKTTTSAHKFRNEYLLKQVKAMRTMFEDLLKVCPKYTELEMRTKVLYSKDGRENSWPILAAQKKFVFEAVLKKFVEKEDERKYDFLLKAMELDDLIEKGIVTTDAQKQDYWKRVGYGKEMNPLGHALDQVKKK